MDTKKITVTRYISSALTSFVIAAVFLNTPISLALPLNCGKKPFENIKALSHKISVIGSDDRMTVSEYAKKHGLTIDQVNRNFSATGTLQCSDGSAGTAQLTNNSSVITTARHLFYDRNCRRSNIKWCKLYLYNNGERLNDGIPLDLSSLIVGPCSKSSPNTSDWIVGRLTKPAPNSFLPYRVPQYPHFFTPRTELTQISGRTSNFKVNGKEILNIIQCPAVSQDFKKNLIHTSCDTGPGTSGAALLVDVDSNPTIAAIHSGAAKENKNFIVPVDQEFIDAVKTLAGP